MAAQRGFVGNSVAQLRRWLALLGLGLAAICASGCTRAEVVPSGASVTIIYKHAKHPRDAVLSEMIQLFEAENPGVRVGEEILPASTGERHQFCVIHLAAGAADFDVPDMDIIRVPEFARAGWLPDL